MDDRRWNAGAAAARPRPAARAGLLPAWFAARRPRWHDQPRPLPLSPLCRTRTWSPTPSFGKSTAPCRTTRTTSCNNIRGRAFEPSAPRPRCQGDRAPADLHGCRGALSSTRALQPLRGVDQANHSDLDLGAPFSIGPSPFSMRAVASRSWRVPAPARATREMTWRLGAPDNRFLSPYSYRFALTGDAGRGSVLLSPEWEQISGGVVLLMLAPSMRLSARPRERSVGLLACLMAGLQTNTAISNG